ncbi:MAG: hypothetical protein WC600_14415 [Desulfobaccales bacterium]
MKIILNSDILHNVQLIKDKLSKRLQELFKVCAERNYVVVIPETALLEFNRYQLIKKEEEVNRIKNACVILETYGVHFDHIEFAELVKPPDLIALIGALGVNVIVEVPTLEDYVKAHRRACLHECPHPPDIKSDEMRDLIIWMIALRISLKEDGALLISNDVCHYHSRGDLESNEVKLVRVKSIEEALEYLDVETPTGKLMAQFLLPFWSSLIEEGLPLNKEMTILGISKARFVQGVRGLVHATCHLKTKTTEGRTLSAVVDIKPADETAEELILSNIAIDGNPLEKPEIKIIFIETGKPEYDDFVERHDALRNIIGDKNGS